ncbi:MAG TPA: PAS domain-containing protein [Victivallales bacterium]|nr:PAS domain-containing protein [Victivallales bacterium]
MKFDAEKFRELRKNKNLSMNNVASKLGINWQTIWNWENRKIIPSEAKIRYLSKCLDIEVNLISDLDINAELSKSNLNDIADSWFSFIDTEGKNEIQYEKLIFNIAKKQSDKLKQATILVNALLSYINAVVYVKDTKLRYMIANNQFKKNLSLNKGYFTKGKMDSDFFSNLEAKKNNEMDRKVIETGIALENIEDFIPGTRKKKWGLISKIPILDSNGKVAGIIGSFIDITDRKKNRELLEINIKDARDGLCIFDYDKGEYLFINNAFSKIYGYSLKEVSSYGSRFWVDKCVHPDFIHIAEDFKQRLMNNITELKIIRSDGEERWIQSTMNKKKIINKNCYIVIERDITEEKIKLLKLEHEIISKVRDIAKNMLRESIDVSIIAKLPD